MEKMLPNGLERMVYSVSEVAAMLDFSEKTIRRLIDKGDLKSYNATRHIRITKASLDEHIARHTSAGK